MTDETAPIETADENLDPATDEQPARKRGRRPKNGAGDEPEMDAAAALRAFEDEKLGPDTPRYDGKVERGHGSHYRRMSDEDRAKHAELEAAADAPAA